MLEQSPVAAPGRPCNPKPHENLQAVHYSLPQTGVWQPVSRCLERVGCNAALGQTPPSDDTLDLAISAFVADAPLV
jgi:hypothetical protein